MSILPRISARALRISGIVGAIVVVAISPWWGKAALRPLAFFRVRSVQVVGAYGVPARGIVDRLHVDTLTSVWDDLGVLERRVLSIPGIRAVTIHRSLPATLVVALTEAVPVALVPTASGMRPYDAQGVLLPFDPTRVEIDVPVLDRADRRALGLLAELRQQEPDLFARVSEVRLDPSGDLLLETPDFAIRTAADVGAARAADALPVAADLERRHVRVRELDVRFRDQVVARRG